VLRDHANQIRECGGDRCAIVYLDTSRSANRRWCSMSRCGNRHKVRERRARQAALAADGVGPDRVGPDPVQPDPTGEPA
jgi:predicted RNA-binding Zn ribbon-like protein